MGINSLLYFFKIFQVNLHKKAEDLSINFDIFLFVLPGAYLRGQHSHFCSKNSWPVTKVLKNENILKTKWCDAPLLTHDLACCASPPRIYSVNFCGTENAILSSLKRVKPKLGEVGGGGRGVGRGVSSLSSCRGNMLAWALSDRFNPPMCFGTKGDKQKGNWLLSLPLSNLTCAGFLIH